MKKTVRKRDRQAEQDALIERFIRSMERQADSLARIALTLEARAPANVAPPGSG